MTIERGREWGSLGPVPADLPTTASDAEVAHEAASAVLAGTPGPVVRVTAGDLWRTLGRPTVPVGAVEAWLLPVDALRVSLDGGPTTVAVAHVVAHRSWWRGPVAAVMNAQFVGDFDVAPRSHPNDGRADVLQTSTMPLRQRILARRRLKAGVHVPHPLIDERRVARADLRFVRPLYVWIDGVAAGEASTVTIEVVPDAFTVAV